MTAEQITRGVAGTGILLSLILAVSLSHWWLLLTTFIGLNLLQSFFTNTCPLLAFLRRRMHTHD